MYSKLYKLYLSSRFVSSFKYFSTFKYLISNCIQRYTSYTRLHVLSRDTYIYKFKCLHNMWLSCNAPSECCCRLCLGIQVYSLPQWSPLGVAAVWSSISERYEGSRLSWSCLSSQFRSILPPEGYVWRTHIQLPYHQPIYKSQDFWTHRFNVPGLRDVSALLRR